MYVVMYSTKKKSYLLYVQKSSLICERDIFQAGDSFLFGGVLARVSSTNEPTRNSFYFIFTAKGVKTAL